MLKERPQSTPTSVSAIGLKPVSLGEIVDLDRYNAEKEQIGKDIKSATDILFRKSEYFPDQNIFSLHHLEAVNLETTATNDAFKMLTKKAVDQKNPNQILTLGALKTLEIARNSLIIEQQDRVEAALTTAGKIRHYPDLPEAFKTRKELTKFFDFGETETQISSTAVADLAANRYSLSDYYRAIVQATIIKSSPALYKTIYDENEKKNAMFRNYPNIAQERIDKACEQLLTLATIGTDLLPFFAQIRPGSHEERLVLDRTKKIINEASDRRCELPITLFSVESTGQAPLLKSVVEEYLDSDYASLKTLALLRIGLTSKEQVILTYRASRELADMREDYSPFYEKLEKTIKDYANNMSQEVFPIFTADDLNHLTLQETTNAKVDRFVWRNIQTANEFICSKSSEQQYELDTKLINFYNLKTPNKISVDFLSSNHSQFTLNLEYQVEDKNPRVLTFSLTDKGDIYWNFIEDPADPKMASLKKTMLLISNSVLSAVKKQVEKELKEQAGQKPTLIWAPREKSKKPKPSKPLTPLRQAEQEGLEDSKKIDNQIKKFLRSPDEETLEKMIKHFSIEIQEEIKKVIREFNETGAGIFKPLKNVRHKSKQIQELKSRQIRILATRSGEINGNDSGAKTLIYDIYNVLHSSKVEGNKRRKNYV